MPQLVLDLAVDALELGGKILNQHPQAPLANIDDLPKLGVLRAAEIEIGEFDPRLDDVAPPRFRASEVRFRQQLWHALSPGVPHPAVQCHDAGMGSGQDSGIFAAWLTALPHPPPAVWCNHDIRASG
jgi:hypothetical protein